MNLYRISGNGNPVGLGLIHVLVDNLNREDFIFASLDASRDP